MKNLLVLLFITTCSKNLLSQTSGQIEIKWETEMTVETDHNLKQISHPYFKGVFFNKISSTPLKIISFKSKKKIKSGKISIQNKLYKSLTSLELNYVLESKIPKKTSIEEIVKKSGNDNLITFKIPAIVYNLSLIHI